MQRIREEGSSVLEFALISTFLFIPLLLVIATVGLSILESIHVVELNRDAGHMFARGVDFSQSANVNLLLELAGGLNITSNSGDGVIILSEIDASSNGQAVCSRQLVVGNGSLHASDFATPLKFTDVSEGLVDITDPSANANAFLNVLSMNSGDRAYVAETYFQGYGLQNLLSNAGIYARSIF
jgi:hypothetical protein